MPNINIRREDGNRPTSSSPVAPVRWEPARVLRDLLSWDPFIEMSPLAPHLPAGFTPQFEVKETKDGFVFKADVPGVKESDLQVTVTGNRLAITGKREAEHQEQTDTFYTYERSFGEFTRTFTLPDGVDLANVLADLKEGVLTVTVRKSPALQPKKVEIQTAAKKS
ncbi:MAG: HSP20 family small heat-shock protein [Polyangiaceae bacterium]|jgi:HSP20 family protein